MLQFEADEYMTSQQPCYTRVSGVLVKVIITDKTTADRRSGVRGSTVYGIKRADNGKALSCRTAAALRMTTSPLREAAERAKGTPVRPNRLRCEDCNDTGVFVDGTNEGVCPCPAGRARLPESERAVNEGLRNLLDEKKRRRP